jgi:Glycosyltransferase family 87
MLLKEKPPYVYILLACIFFILDVIIENVNHKFQLNDFGVYYAASAALANGKPLYGIAFTLGSGYYKYSPFIAFMFYPISLLPYFVACIFDCILICLTTLFISLVLNKIFREFFFTTLTHSANLLLSMALLCIATHLVRELELGNVNVFMLFLAVISLQLTLKKKYRLSALLIALVIITKPFFVLLFLPLFMHKYYKVIACTFLFVVIFLIMPVLLVGINKNTELHKEWLNTMLVHADAFPSPNTIEALLRSNLNLPVQGYFQYLVMGLLLIPYLVFIKGNIRLAGKNENKLRKNFILEWFILIALTPSIFKTDTEHFLMAYPVILFLIMYLACYPNKKILLVFMVLIILYAGNSSDLLGKELSLKAYNLGILGISNILLVSLAIYSFQVMQRPLMRQSGVNI